MAHINEIRCFGCHKRIGTYIDGDTKGAEVVQGITRKMKSNNKIYTLTYMSTFCVFCTTKHSFKYCLANVCLRKHVETYDKEA